MFDEPEEKPPEHSFDPVDQAREKSDSFRMHAELAAVFEGVRKFDAQLLPGLDAEIARDIQRTMGKLEKAKAPETPLVIDPAAMDAAGNLLNLAKTRELPTNDYHIHRRPGEVMVVRWLEGDEVETFYTRIQAHFDAALEGFKEDFRQAQGWKKDPKTAAFLEAVDAIEVKIAERYLREMIRQHNLYVLSTQTADELNIAYLADHLMGVNAAEIVGAVSAPPDEDPSEKDLAWFYKLFSLRGMKDGVEQMCFFMYLQKTDEGW